jgi:hypothetical protein
MQKHIAPNGCLLMVRRIAVTIERRVRDDFVKQQKKGNEMNWKERAACGLIRTERIGDFTVRVYKDRIAIRGVSECAISWEILQKIKRQVLGDVVAVEIFPIDSDVVNLANTRHLWFSPNLAGFLSQYTHEEFACVPPAGSP